MGTCVFFKDEEKYQGNYVAKTSFGTEEVIASGESLESVYREASAKGVDNPVVFFIAPDGVSHVY